MENLKIFKAPTNKEEAFKKWETATRMLKAFVAVGLLTEEKIKQAEGIASIK